MDHGAGVPGNFEALYPFNEETTRLADAVGSANNDIELQERVRCMVDSVRRYEKHLFRQNPKRPGASVGPRKRKDSSETATVAAVANKPAAGSSAVPDDLSRIKALVH